MCTHAVLAVPIAFKSIACALATHAFAAACCTPADVDACIAFPCQQSLAAPALCTDLANAPNTTAGRTCACDDGYAYADGEGGGCSGETYSQLMAFCVTHASCSRCCYTPSVPTPWYMLDGSLGEPGC